MRLLEFGQLECLVVSMLSAANEAEEILETLTFYLRNPLHLHVPAIREAHRQDLSTLSEQLEGQSSTMKRLQAVTNKMVNRLESSRVQAHNAASPLSSLPIEVVRHIQLLAYEAAPKPRDKVSRVLSHISPSWRNAALDQSILWSEISQTSRHPEAFHELLQRSGQRDVELYIHSDHGVGARDRYRVIEDRLTFMDNSPALPFAASRFKSLAVLVNDPSRLQQCADDNGAFPALTELMLEISEVPQRGILAYELHTDKIFKPTAITMPKLDYLILRASHVPNLLEIGSQLRHLTLIRCTLHEPHLTNLLVACRNLVELYLVDSAALGLHAMQSTPAWELPELTSLAVEQCTNEVLHHIFTRLSLPEVRSLRLTFRPVEYSHSSEEQLEADLRGEVDMGGFGTLREVFESLPTFVSEQVDSHGSDNALNFHLTAF